MPEDIQCVLFLDDSNTNQKKLFEQALLSAEIGRVLYILRNELSELPQLSQDFSSENAQYMKMISFLYTESLESLIESVSTLPDWQNVPKTIILEDLSEYCGKNLQNACGVVAMMINAARSCSISLNMSTALYISVTRNSVCKEYTNTLEELYTR